MLDWVSQFSIFCFLDNNNYPGINHSFECLVAAGSIRSIELAPPTAFHDLQEFYDQEPGWLFGHLGYDINNNRQVNLKTEGFSDGYFFSPEILLRLTSDELIIEIHDGDHNQLYDSILKSKPITIAGSHIVIDQKISKVEYADIINKIKSHIKRGDCYELNFCQEFFSQNVVIDPLLVYKKLHQVSPNPFSAFYRINDNYCMSASPERYLKKEGLQLLSQPIKGTSRRDPDPVKDEVNKTFLKNNAKEQSENVMIVDLVRNDLSRVCTEGSVYVEEMFGLYSFPQVHQMISTIKGTLPVDTHFTEAIAATFPMGSMTGAPKIRVIELIRQYEINNRGLFSGSIGYITPEADFDFNVIIRSIFYNKIKRYLSFLAGSAITFKSEADLEYEECLIKAEAMMKALQ